MSVVTKEAQVSNLINQLTQFAATLYSLSQQAAFINAQWTNLSAATALAAYPTTAVLTTGVLGTADGTPVVTNPIDTRVAPGNDLNRPISSNNTAALLQLATNLQAICNGATVAADGAMPQLIAMCL